MRPVLFAIISVFVFASACVWAQPRDVFWIHGLNGERGSANLDASAVFFDGLYPRIETSFSPASGVHTRSAGVQAIADHFRNRLGANATANNDPTIIVGHSLGGVIAKELDIRARTGRANGVNAHGVISLGSPLNGARIANSMSSPLFPNWLLGPQAPVNTFASNVAYNLGRCTLPGGQFLATQLYNTFLNTARNFNNTVSFGTLGHTSLWREILPLVDQTWRDLRTNGYAATSNIATTTPKLNLWANIPRPALQTLMNNQGSGDVYRDVVNYTRAMYDIYRWIPGLGATMAREAVAAEGYFLFTIHGQYVNLIADGVRFERRTQDYKAKQNITTCWTEARQVATQSCRNWGWFRWLCTTVVQTVSFTNCSVNEVIATHTVAYDFPIYPDTDGVVSAASAIAEGSNWRGVDIEVPECDHAQLTGARGRQALRGIFNGTNVRLVFRPERDIFLLE